MGLFNDRKINNTGKTTVPVWFMRQAGRYHNHYQNIKKDSDFMSMCKTPKLAHDITMGPIEEFHFDAAILFSDLLFPLEQLNMGLSYHSGPPTLEVKLSNLEAINRLNTIEDSKTFYQFQNTALSLLKPSLPKDTTLLGFVGAPFTLYSYACEGAHKGNLIDSKKGLFDGRFNKFIELLIPNLLENMIVQREGGADAICLFDTAVGELPFQEFNEIILPVLKKLIQSFKKIHPDCKIVYYSKLTHLDYLEAIDEPKIDVLGIDWRVNLTEALDRLGDQYYIQGNLDPSYLHLPWNELEKQLAGLWNKVTKSKIGPEKWICGLGHGVLPLTPQENVKMAVKYIHEHFNY